MLGAFVTAAIKDFVPVATAAIGAVGGYLGAMQQRRHDAKRLRHEAARGTPDDPAFRRAAYVEYITCLDAFYDAGTSNDYVQWWTRYSAAATSIRIVGEASVKTAIDDVSKILGEIREKDLVELGRKDFEKDWYEAVERCKESLDAARESVIQRINADVGMTAQR